VPAAVVAAVVPLTPVVAAVVSPAMVISWLAVIDTVIAGFAAGREHDAVPMATAVVAGLPVLAAVIPDLGVMRGEGAGICGRPEGDRSRGSGGEGEGCE
jgi:hypothetical protein